MASRRALYSSRQVSFQCEDRLFVVMDYKSDDDITK